MRRPTMPRGTLSLPRETDRLVLRRPDPADAAAVQDAIEESFAELHPWMPWARELQSLDQTRAYLERARDAFSIGEDFAVSAYLKSTGEFVIGAGLHARNPAVPTFEIGYWCRTSMQRQGLTTEVVRALTSAALDELGAGRLEIRCDTHNVASRRVAEKAGFRLEAVLRHDDRANDGDLRDTAIYTMLAVDRSP